MDVQPYLFFEGRCEEAIAFYRAAVRAEVTNLVHYSYLNAGAAAVAGDKVMHASLRIGASTICLSDGHCEKPAEFKGFALSIVADDAAQAVRMFEALSEGGQVTTPMKETFFSERFGMVTDRFGVLWMVYVGS